MLTLKARSRPGFPWHGSEDLVILIMRNKYNDRAIMNRLPLALQTAYADLLDKLMDASLAEQVPPQGNFVAKTVKGRRYWYTQSTGADGRQVQTYVGPETPELLERIERFRDLKSAARARRDLVRALTRSGTVPEPSARMGKVLEALAVSGVFRLRGVLVGTMAYQTYGPMLGVRLGSAAVITEDVDVAQFRSISIAVEDCVPPVLNTLRAVEAAFQPIDKPFHEGVPIAYRSDKQAGTGRKEAIKIEFLTPMQGPDEDAPGKLPALGTGSQPLRFLDFLIYQERKAVVLHGGGVLVNVPDPARYALHKLIVSQRRNKADKARKDLMQAEALLDVLAEDRPFDLADLWDDLCDRGPKWQELATAGLQAIAPRVRTKVLDARTS